MKDRRHAIIWIVLLTVLAAAVRLPLLGHESFWKDELSIWSFVNVPTLSQAIYNGAIVDPHPPLYMVVVFPMVHLFGMSEAAFRLPSALFGIVSVPLIYDLGTKLFTWREGVISAAFMALMFRPLYYSLEARNYILLGLTSITLGIAWAAVTRAISEKRPIPVKTLFGYSILVVLAPYSHYFGALLGLVMFIHLIWRSAALKSGQKSVWILMGFTALLYSPWLPFAAKTFSRSNSAFWIPKPHIDAPVVFFAFFFGKSPILVGLMTLLVFGYLIFTLVKPENAGTKEKPNPLLNKEFALLLAVWLAGPFCITLAKSLVSTSFFLNRYFFICLPAAYLCAARGITLLGAKRGSPIFAPALTACILSGAWISMVFQDHVFFKSSRAQYREAVNYVSRQVTGHSGMTMPVLTTQPMLAYYTDRPGTGLTLVAADHIDTSLPTTQNYLDLNHPSEFWYLDARDDYRLDESNAIPPFAPTGYKPRERKKFKDIAVIHFVNNSEPAK